MEWYVDGGCRGNGQPGSIAAAAAVETLRWGKSWIHRIQLPQGDMYNPPPTNQRAEIAAIILALKKALERYNDLDSAPRINLTIHSDSRYAVDCMTTWIYNWSCNGWTNARGNPVANKDLIQEASNLDDDLRALGKVTYKWIPRHENQQADKACNEEMDKMSGNNSDNNMSDYYSSDDYY